jgi:hypothetical protein
MDRKMKRTLLFLILFANTLVMAMEYPEPFKDFVADCQNSKLANRINQYRAKMNDLKQDNYKFGLSDCLMDLISEIAKQKDFESLELLEKDLTPHQKESLWVGVASNDKIEGAKKLLAKWAIENPSVPLLMLYHPNGLNLLIETAENKNTGIDEPDTLFLERTTPLATMPRAQP